MVHYSISQIIDVHVYQVYAWATCSKQVIEVSVVQRGDGSQANRFAYVLVSSACVCVPVHGYGCYLSRCHGVYPVVHKDERDNVKSLTCETNVVQMRPREFSMTPL